jgi:hypothetical protein
MLRSRCTTASPGIRRLPPDLHDLTSCRANGIRVLRGVVTSDLRLSGGPSGVVPATFNASSCCRSTSRHGEQRRHPRPDLRRETMTVPLLWMPFISSTSRAVVFQFRIVMCW